MPEGGIRKGKKVYGREMRQAGVFQRRIEVGEGKHTTGTVMCNDTEIAGAESCRSA
jgi:hypothetical protein